MHPPRWRTSLAKSLLPGGAHIVRCCSVRQTTKRPTCTHTTSQNQLQPFREVLHRLSKNRRSREQWTKPLQLDQTQVWPMMRHLGNWNRGPPFLAHHANLTGNPEAWRATLPQRFSSGPSDARQRLRVIITQTSTDSPSALVALWWLHRAPPGGTGCKT